MGQQDPFRAMAGSRIAHLIESSGAGGAERIVVEMALEQSARGCPVTVFLPAGGDGWLAEQLEGSAVGVERYHLNSPLSPACVREIGRAFRRLDITIAHSHEFSMAIYGACAAWIVGIPHVVTMHGGRYYAERIRRRLAMRWAVAGSDAIVAVGDAVAVEMSVALFVDCGRIAVIPNGVRPVRLAASTLRAEVGIPAGVPLILAVGSLYPVKGHRFLIEALAHLDPTAHLVIAGRGDAEGGLIELAERLGLADRVHLMGLRDDVPNLLGAADIFVQPSLSEGLPLALLEAMFAARPIVASDVGDIQRAVGADGALLVAPGDAASLAFALGQLLADPALRRSLGASAERRAVRTFGLVTMVDTYGWLYARLLGVGRPERRAKRRTESRVDRRVADARRMPRERRSSGMAERRRELDRRTPLAVY